MAHPRLLYWIFTCAKVGAIDTGVFFSDPLQELIKEKRDQLAEEGYGYQVIPFEHHQQDGGDYGLRVIELNLAVCLATGL